MKGLVVSGSRGVNRHVLAEVLDELPDDAKLVGCQHDWTHNTITLYFESEEFDPVAVGVQTPVVCIDELFDQAVGGDIPPCIVY